MSPVVLILGFATLSRGLKQSHELAVASKIVIRGNAYVKILVCRPCARLVVIRKVGDAGCRHRISLWCSIWLERAGRSQLRLQHLPPMHGDRQWYRRLLRAQPILSGPSAPLMAGQRVSAT